MVRSSRSSRTGNRYRSSPGTVRLYARTGKKKRHPEQSIWAGVVLAMVALLVAGAVGYAGILLIRDMLFTENRRYEIEKIEIQGGAVKTEEIIREYLDYVGIAPGKNLFSYDMDLLRSLYLERNPLVHAVRVERILPDTLRFYVWEREPLARLGQRGTLVVDRDGYVFRLRQGLHRLPVIIEKGETGWSPGQTVSGMLTAAIEVLEVCDNPRIGLRIMGVDVRHSEYLLIHVLTADGIKEARLSWLDMGQNTEVSRNDLELRLGRLVQVAQQDRSGRSLLDATIPGRIYVR